jgi:ATP-dependent DNA helicase PIF1
MQGQLGSENDLNQMAISEDDRTLLEKFHEELSSITMQECNRCREKWFDMDVRNSICQRCRNPNKANVFSDTNHMDPGPSIQQLALENGLKVPEPLSQVEEMMISPVHLLHFTHD